MSRLCVIIGVFFLAVVLSSGAASGEDLVVAFEGENISAHVEDYPLKAVADRIEKEKGIRFEGRESLLQQKIFADFDDLPLEQGLEVILSKMNYSLVFDGKDEIVGVFLFKSLEPSQKSRLRNVRSSARNRPRVLPRRRPQPFRN
jgi:hypothetical protein